MKLKFKTYFILKSLPRIGNVKALKIAKELSSDAKNAHSLLNEYKQIRNNEKNLPDLELSDFDSAFNSFEREIEFAEKENIKLVGFDDDNYPLEYKNIKEPPCVLFVKGDVSKLKEKNKLAIIGSRDATDYAKSISKKIGNLANENNVVVVSGLAKGCDEYAHKGSLKNGGTIAILPSGLKNIYPTSNKALANDIIENGGCLVTEYFYDVAATKYNFVARDRLQSGLSKVVVLVESKIDGGSMKTINFAIEQNVKIYCWKHDEKYFDFNKCSGNQKLLEIPGTEKLENGEDCLRMINHEFSE